MKIVKLETLRAYGTNQLASAVRFVLQLWHYLGKLDFENEFTI
jgi:hypothetical protein